ncbi:hypothetical protein AGMMS49944_09950 [Spirochaetia bacterium]|nr:hypothetical protein AGMMS49944_09950 [Spirochaetia bacterium]
MLDLAERITKEAAAAGFNLTKVSELEEKLGTSASDMKRAAAFLREKEDLRILEGGFLFPRGTRERLLEVLASMQSDITVASLRDSIGVSRKYTLPMLEFFDAQGLTRREGDKRILVK